MTERMSAWRPNARPERTARPERRRSEVRPVERWSPLGWDEWWSGWGTPRLL